MTRVAHLWQFEVIACGECRTGVMDFGPDGVAAFVCANPECGVAVLIPRTEPKPRAVNPYTRTRPRRRRRG